METSFLFDDVDGAYQKIQNLNLDVAQVPTDMNFGRTFLVLDPDGHRIRFYKLAENPS